MNNAVAFAIEPSVDNAVTITTEPAVAVAADHTVENWARIIREDLGRAVEGIIAAGRHLQEAKDGLGHGDWLPLLKATGLGERTAQRLMKIAANEVLTNPTHWVALPMSMRTLSELAALPPDLLEAKIIDGTITPELERKDVALLKGKTPATVPNDGLFTPSAPRAPKAAIPPAVAKQIEAQQAHIEDLEAAREAMPSEPAETERRFEIENAGLRSEIEELRAEREQLRARIAELERALEQAKAGAHATAAPKKRGRPKGSKNKGG